jgi:hypothetical protein
LPDFLSLFFFKRSFPNQRLTTVGSQANDYLTFCDTLFSNDDPNNQMISATPKDNPPPP